MGRLDRLFSYTQQVMSLTREVRDLGEDVEKLREEHRDLDRRLVKVETIIELARESSRQLPRDR